MLVVMHDLVAAFDGPIRERAVEEGERVSGLDMAVAENPEVEAGEAVCLDSGGEVLHLPTAGEFPAGLAGLGDLDFCFTKAVAVADAGFRFKESFEREIFAESAVGEIRDREGVAPVGVMFGGVNADGFLGTAVVFAIRLFIAAEAFVAEPAGFGLGFLVESGLPWLVPPFAGLLGLDLADRAEVEGQDFRMVHGELGWSRISWRT